MPKLTIDNREVEVPPGATILVAARKLGIDIPTLCFLEGCTPSTSCMVCLVKLRGPGRLVPACASLAEDGMEVESEIAEVREARREALELLLSDHLGDCVGPCHATCPAHMNIPRMIRQIAAGALRDAIATVKEQIALPAVLGRICPAPCEKACRRGVQDAAVSICLLKRFVADVDYHSAEPYLPPCKPASGKHAAIVGAGPAGLAAAYYLLQDGHACELFDDHEKPGGMLQYAVPEARLPRDVLDAEIAVVRRLGADFHLGVRVGDKPSLGDLRKEFDAVLIAAGELREEEAARLGLAATAQGVEVDRHTLQTSSPGVFAAGSAVRKQKMAVRAVADGKAAAASIGQFLRGVPVTGPRGLFSTHIGRLRDGEIEKFMAEAAAIARLSPSGGEASGFTDAEARQESSRCLHCDCRKPLACKLRQYADQYEASPSKYDGDRRLFEQQVHPAGVVYEPGKCIACGICIQIAASHREALGLTFIGRGFAVRVGVPFNRSIAEGLAETAAECAAACPTGALAISTHRLKMRATRSP
jgi:NADPH-dependent glutamate synthase beta subunit-like oxidoreductase